MSGFLSFVTGFCSVCILIGMLYMLVPEGTMSNSVKYVFALCFMCCILSGTVGISKINVTDLNLGVQQSYVTENMAARTAEQIFSHALRSKNIDFTKIRVITDKTDGGGISIIKVTVYSSATAEDIYSVISSDDYEVNVING